jgi:hypothetical protein
MRVVLSGCCLFLSSSGDRQDDLMEFLYHGV